MSIALNLFLLTVLLEMSEVVLLSVFIGVLGCEWPISCNASRKNFLICALLKKAPNSASAADAATFFKIVYSVFTAPFNLIGCLGCGMEAIKKNPTIILLIFGSVK